MTPVLTQPSSGTLTQAEIDQKIQDAVQKEVAKVKEQLRDEVRAEIQGAQSASEFLGEQEEKKKLHFLELNGYFRFRWDLFNNLNGGLPADPMGWYVWGGNTELSTSPPDGTQTGGNMRLRVDPTFNVSEQVRVKAEIDFLDNVVLGSTPTGRDYNLYSFTSSSQVSPVAGYNWFTSAIQVKRAWGEVQTPVGLLSFGRMPADWGAGIYYNAGGGIDQDFGDNVDRIQFSIPLGQFLGGLAVTPYYEWAGFGHHLLQHLQHRGDRAARQLDAGRRRRRHRPDGGPHRHARPAPAQAREGRHQPLLRPPLQLQVAAVRPARALPADGRPP